jgi:hypothetical protein
MNIKLDLNDLTQERVDEATPHLGIGCTYAAPCIIGTLVPVKLRETLDEGELFCADEPDVAITDSTVTTLALEGYFEFPEGQREEAQELQTAFDNGNAVYLELLLAKRGLKLNQDLIPHQGKNQ